jgi:iron complex transport system permease protein
MQALIQFSVSPEALTRIVHWSLGDLQKGDWLAAGVATGALVTGFLLLMGDAWALTALRLGEARAAALGVNVRRVRRRALAATALLTAGAVCFVGTIGFVGLVAPHLARGLVGEDHRLLMPASALTGAAMLAFSSVLAKVLVPGVSLPATVVTALIGVPFLFLLIHRTGRRG